VTESVQAGSRMVAHYLLLVCRMDVRAGRLRRSREGEVRWFRLAELQTSQRELVPSDRLMIERLLLRPGGQRYFSCRVKSRQGGYRVVAFE
jgi:hypothetical protein